MEAGSGAGHRQWSPEGWAEGPWGCGGALGESGLSAESGGGRAGLSLDAGGAVKPFSKMTALGDN